MVKVINFGCRLNSYESAVIKQNASKSGLGDDFVIFNSCAVTNAAEKEFVKEVKKIKNESPEKKIILTGCAVQANPQKYIDMGFGDFIIGNKEKTNPEIYTQIKAGKLEIEIEPEDIQKRHEDKLFFEDKQESVHTQNISISKIKIGRASCRERV